MISVNDHVMALPLIKAGGGLPKAANSLKWRFIITDMPCVFSNSICRGVKRSG